MSLAEGVAVGVRRSRLSRAKQLQCFTVICHSNLYRILESRDTLLNTFSPSKLQAVQKTIWICHSRVALAALEIR